MNKPKIAYVTAAISRDVDEDLPLVESALRDAGADVTIAEWDRPHDWSRFDLAVLRSPWDYPQRLAEFLSWAEATSRQTKLLNSLSIVKWNCDKHYLADLAKKNVPTVPSAFVEPGEEPERKIAALLSQPDVAEFVAKPAVGGGSRDAQRFGREERADAAAHARRMLSEKRSVLLQPYLNRIDEHGETALIYFDGEFSHAIRKGALLKRKEGPKSELFAKEAITVRAPDAAELSLGARALQAIPFGTPLYARVDLIRDQNGEPVVLELELLEPSLFFPFAADAAGRFARAVVRRAKD